MTKSAKRRYRRHLAEERDAAAVYRAMAARSEGERREILLELALAEDRHASHWATKLEEAGESAGAPGRRGWRAGVLILIARLLGVRAVVPLLERGEATEINRYHTEPAAPEHMVVDERVHARTVATLFPSWRTRASGSLRAATFGANDGLVSNLALVMGVAGGQASDRTILLAGLAGLLGGGLSMGIGEWISVTSQRELWQGEIELDSEHVAALPEGGSNELALLLRARGLPPAEAEARAAEIVRDPDAAARLLASEKLGFDPRALGSPAGAAFANFGAFVLGASVPVVPYVVASGTAAFVGAVVAAALALYLVGALISVITYRPMWLAGLRQLAIGALAAGLTYALGTVVGGALG
jgi:VIT1/CCC1 family predicted Fe2+/Mn2+ transporter